MDLWEITYPTSKSNTLHIALTDTFSTDAFNLVSSLSRLIEPVLTYYIQSFTADKARAERWRGLRQDSGDPFEFIAKARATYEKMGVDYRKKVIVFSDGLDVELSIKIQKVIDEEGFIGALVSRIRKGANACVQVRMVLEHFSQMTTKGRTMVRGVNH
jgi:nicotinate phosphoribosyltransferase